MKKQWRIFSVLSIAALLLTACGSSSMSGKSATTESAAYDSYSDYAYDEGVYTAEGAVENEEYYDDSAAVEENVENSGRKLIRTANLEVETEHYDELMSDLEQQVQKLGGYIESLSSNDKDINYDGSQRMRYGTVTARIPQDRLDEFLNHVGEEANVTMRMVDTEDVTLQYVDLESHKKALTIEQERLMELLDQAENIEDIITIENRLSEVRYQIESMESQIRTFDNKIDYSTVDITVQEVEKYTPPADITTGEKIRTGFMESLEGVGTGLSNFGVAFIINLPYIVVWVVIIGAIVFAILKILKISAKRAEKRKANRKPYTVRPNMGNPYAGYGQGQKPYLQQNTQQPPQQNAVRAQETPQELPKEDTKQ